MPCSQISHRQHGKRGLARRLAFGTTPVSQCRSRRGATPESNARFVQWRATHVLMRVLSHQQSQQPFRSLACILKQAALQKRRHPAAHHPGRQRECDTDEQLQAHLQVSSSVAPSESVPACNPRRVAAVQRLSQPRPQLPASRSKAASQLLEEASQPTGMRCDRSRAFSRDTGNSTMPCDIAVQDTPLTRHRRGTPPRYRQTWRSERGPRWTRPPTTCAAAPAGRP